MKTIGLLGGMSWESTVTYYQIINQEVKSHLGGLHSAKLFLYSVNFEEIERLQHQGQWDQAATLLTQAAQKIETAGADFLLICTNTMHKVAPTIETNITIPLLHIADATAQQIHTQTITTVGLLGTKFTMEDNFYKGRLISQHNIDVITPNTTERQDIHQIIYDELCLGKLNDVSRARFLQIIQSLATQGAQAIILGCTEIALLIQQPHTPIPLLDTTTIHAKAAVKAALSLTQ